MSSEYMIGDAWGELLRDCHAAGLPAGRYYEICERDDGYISAYDAVGFFEGPGGWPPLDRWACEQARGRVLDVGVGAGRFSLPLQADGVDVVGLDVSPGALKVCAERGLGSTVRGTAGDLDDMRRFDSFLLLGKNLGLLESREQGPRLLAALRRLARPGARILGTGVDPYLLDGAVHGAYLAKNRRHGRLSGQMRLRLRHLLTATAWFDYLFVSPAELSGMTAGTGWSVVDTRTDGAQYAAVLALAPDAAPH
ncbi:hypothetical protein GCM10018793_54570 [Streptomyces sulfonofaciens]|uniref:Methyltransferase domain-containing protein n=1 Tax=Streptomyces sulfonofaciens TaxID=68272 RepID=A0A919GKH9_9ACTN|nr:class I SAM-dependent methyltransferase [Streptomyces sulfonofaciens]GHH85668.1 hypothetical protein GCM10018793_54570 [Streptomyces sulfonofaciens]